MEEETATEDSIEARLTRLENGLAEMHDMVWNLSSAAVLDDDRQPYFAELARKRITGDRLQAVTLTILAILSRAEGEAPPVPKDPHLLERFPGLQQALAPESITPARAIELLGSVLGSALGSDEKGAIRLLEAHRRQGFGRRAHQELGL